VQYADVKTREFLIDHVRAAFHAPPGGGPIPMRPGHARMRALIDQLRREYAAFVVRGDSS
jgi:hypothetical protein